MKNGFSTLPNEAHQSLHRLGQRLRAHRVNQAWTVADMAQRLLCSPTTYRALEAGKPGTSLGVLLQALWLTGQLDTLEQVAPAPAALAAGRRVRRARDQALQGRITEDERDF